MELFIKILQKSEINKRFGYAVIEILRQNLISSKAGLAESLQIKPAKFSEILNGRMNVGSDTLAFLCDNYKISPDWLLMGRGSNMFRQDLLPAYWIEDEDHPLNTDSSITMKTSAEIEQGKPNDLQNSGLVAIIREQAEEIGRLKEQVRQLRQQQGDNASDAASS